MKALKSVNIEDFKTVDDILIALDLELENLRSMAKETDFSAPSQVEQFQRNILFIRRYYDRAEYLLTNKV